MPDVDPQILKKLPSNLAKDLDKNLCTCMDVPKKTIINAIVNGATTLDEVKKKTCAMMGAGCCEQQIEAMIKCLCAPERRRRRKKKAIQP